MESLTWRARWETETRWYEVHVTRDLFGAWVVVRNWGGKGSAVGGGKSDVVLDAGAAQARVAEIDKRRRSRRSPYTRVF